MSGTYVRAFGHASVQLSVHSISSFEREIFRFLNRWRYQRDTWRLRAYILEPPSAFSFSVLSLATFIFSTCTFLPASSEKHTISRTFNHGVVVCFFVVFVFQHIHERYYDVCSGIYAYLGTTMLRVKYNSTLFIKVVTSTLFFLFFPF